MDIRSIMSEDPVVMEDTQQVAYARNLMLRNGISRVVVVDPDGKPVGIVTETDITRKLKVRGPAWRRRPIDKISIRRVMNENPISIDVNDTPRDAADLMLKNRVGSLLVMDGDELAGIITKKDLLRFFKDRCAGRWKVRDLMTGDVKTVTENHTISHVIGIMEENDISRVVVTRDGGVAGIITSENLSFATFEDPEKGIPVEKVYFIRKTSEDKRKVRTISMLTAGDIMTEDVITVDPSADASEAASIMLENNISGLPVVEDDELVGIITKTDIISGIQ
ncbi:CBS domain-containing protein [Methanothermobacter wolfeii]|uniref:CBS domain-containing protein n=1 Tax=Methanothermobacter wolfeii TaxID=145261 RepID=A0A9E7RTT6_METWO|nr:MULTISPECIES: CBS domain-containing protein [Methanothermobacter]NLM02482.1 CBS domain-containing protein [Methanothermobacter wolfeii]QHN06957.1 CBS domain-containing protein [Methanothermobacter sp. THM-1]UXH31545.1 CBS domain-containing protein [Methanothermobacter wolfeii]SCM58411.1 Inosine-5'-monophosphate dehydrogenase {ECO:0000255/HAMAP-Rule:MF_01964} [Methanothermobacter wolfeii]